MAEPTLLSSRSEYGEGGLKLPEEERARVAHRLSESLSGLPDFHAHGAWVGEIALKVQRRFETA